MDRCPKCGREGKKSVKRVVSKGRVYWYEVFRHSDGSVCIIRRLNEEEVEALRPPVSRLEYELLGAKRLIELLLEEVWRREEALLTARDEALRTLYVTRLYLNHVAKLVKALVEGKDLSSGEDS
ncbi:MAG: hypothetical protein DRJ57_01230 [Thermoprotei archaeon]|nr:MAG: hypothetical protein DRJ57_01230 [Thermoprotei archaeon]